MMQKRSVPGWQRDPATPVAGVLIRPFFGQLLGNSELSASRTMPSSPVPQNSTLAIVRRFPPPNNFFDAA
jgi:hypothetical protein